MSFVNIFIIKDDNVYFISTHYKNAIKVLNRPENILPCLRSKFLDAGYIVVDLNKKLIVNSQSAFAVRLKNVDILET